MAGSTIRQLAEQLRLPVERLLEQLKEAGMVRYTRADQELPTQDKERLVNHLRSKHGKAPNVSASTPPSQITLKRRTTTELPVTGAAGAGRSGKTVSVQVVQKKTYVKRDAMPEAKPSAVMTEAERERQEALAKLQQSSLRREAEEIQRREAEKRRAEEEARARAAEEERRKLAEEIERRRLEEVARREAEEEARRKREIEQRVSRPAATPAFAPAPAPARPDKPRGGPAKPGRGGGRPTEDADNRFGTGELHLSHDRRPAKKKSGKRPDARQSFVRHGFNQPTAPVVREVEIGDSIIVNDLAQALAVKGAEVVKALFKMGMLVTINQVIDHDTAALVVDELGHKVKKLESADVEQMLERAMEQGKLKQETRPPVVTIMGHVDHGKTSLLDYIRRTRVAAGEAGGITQHIGAYHVTTKKGVITFLDTPGHAAFTQMRARGAKVTDIVILVVAADDGVMPQTIEAIRHAKAAGVPLVVAINKIDKHEANPQRVKEDLLQHEVVLEEFGGDVQSVPVSAKTGVGIDELLDAVLVQAEVLELTTNHEGRARGTVIESSLDKGRGAVATVLVQSGTLKKGDIIIAGTQWGRVRAMYDETGRQVAEAGPSIPVQVIGLQGTPNAGDDFLVLAEEKLAREAVAQREQKLRNERLATSKPGNLQDIFSQLQSGESKTLNIVLKADVQGSVEAIRDALVKLSHDEVKVNVITAAVGGITESDASLAVASKAMVIGFNVRADAQARKVLSDAGIEPNYFSIIYEAVDTVKKALSGMLGSEIQDKILGVAQVREVFRNSKFGAVAGCMVLEGVVKRNKPIRVLRDNVVIFQGELESLRRFKDAVEEVRNNMECGIAVKGYEVKVGDQIECYDRIEVARTL
jgi:translation initiation factor IF-2